MKKVSIFLRLVIFLLAFCSISCRQEIEDDEDVFKSFEPLEWSDDYVFAATNEPDSIQVWDTKSYKLVRVYKFFDEKDTQRFLEIKDITVLEKSIWFIACRKQTNLVKLDIETGKLNFIKLDFSPYSLSAVLDSESKKEVLWVNSFGNPKYGMDFAMFSNDGELKKTCNIKSENLQGTVAGNIFCEDGTFYIYGDGFRKTTDEEAESCISLINLDTSAIQNIDNRLFFPEGFLAQEFENIKIPDYMIGIDMLEFEEKKYLSTSLVSSYITEIQDNLAARLLYKIKNTIPLEVQYMNIKWGAKRIKKILENDENIITIGMSADSKDVLAEVSFISTSGNEEKCVELLQANMFFLQSKGGCTYISKNQAYTNISSPKIYMLEHESGNVYEISADGSSVLVDYIDGEADYIKIPQ